MIERERVCVGVLEAVGRCDGEEGKTRDGLTWPRFYVVLACHVLGSTRVVAGTLALCLASDGAPCARGDTAARMS